MLLYRLLLSLALLLSYSSASQSQGLLIEGQVLNTRTNEPVPFAILGIRGRSIGTAADEQGRYVLRLSDLNDTLIVSCVGFQRYLVSPALLVAGQRVFRLNPQDQVLQGVRVEHRRLRPGLLGRSNEKYNLRWTGGSSGKTTVDDEWGWEIGALLEPTRRTYLEEFHVYLADNKYEQLRFRLNLYTIENNEPAEPLLSQDIQLICPTNSKGWFTVDLRSYDIVLDGQPVAATIQWIQSEKTAPEQKYFSIPVIRQSRRGMVERENGNASWTIHNMQPSLYFTVMTE